MNEYLFDGIRILTELEDGSYDMDKAHIHSEYEIYYLSEGSRLFYMKGTTYPMVAGCIAFIDGEKMHRVFSKSDNPHKRFLICLGKDYVCHELPEFIPLLDKGGCLCPTAKGQTEIEALLREIGEECRGDLPMREQAVALTVKKLLIEIYRINEKSNTDVSYGGSDIIRIITYIKDRYTERIVLKEIADYLNISESHLTRLFKASTGYTVVEYVNNLRIRKAAELLRETTRPVSQIAMENGFPSFSYFSKLFYRSYGVSPLKYRKQNSSDNG